MKSRNSPSVDLPRSRRVVSMASTSTIQISHLGPEPASKEELYKYVLKVILLEYSNEARFRTPILESIKQTTRPSSNRSSMVFDQKIPQYALKNLKTQLQLIMTNKKQVDEKFRRSLLRIYGELLDPNLENEVRKIDFLIPKFAAFANQELKKVSQMNDDEITDTVFEQTRQFVDFLIEIVTAKKDYDPALISQLKARKDSFQTSNAKLQPESNQNVKYPTKSYRISDMNKSFVDLLKKIFDVDDTKLQQDVFKYKDIALAKPLHHDVQELAKIQVNLDNFSSDTALQQWKERQEHIKSQVINRYKIPSDLTLLPIPPIPSDEDYYVLPKNGELRIYFQTLVKCIMNSRNQMEFSDPNEPFFEKNELDLINICARAWHIDYPTRAVALYSAAQSADALVDFPLDTALKKSTPVNITASEKLFHLCKQMVEDGNLDWDEKTIWSIEDQNEWVNDLSESYSQVFNALKENLQLIFNETVKPKFGPYLQFLGDYIESDALFPLMEETNLPKKWEKRLTKSLMKVAGGRYGEYLASLPRNGSVNVIHIINVCDSLIADIKKLQKRYKNPLLGFLNVARTVASITTGMFASDAEATLNYIKTILQNNDERIPYADALEVYQLLNEIRDIHNQVTPAGSVFKFDLEKFFYPYLEAWVNESDEKVHGIVNEALKKDNYEPIDLDEDDKRSSHTILDIFAIIKQYVMTIKKQNWNDENQINNVYTVLLKSISNGALFYSDQVSKKIIQELQPPVPEPTEEEIPESKKNWLHEVKNVVSNIQNFKRPEPEVVYNFEATTCVALNNLSAMMNQLTKLEDWIDVETLSATSSSPKQYLSHVFSIRIVRGENLRASKDAMWGKINPYVAAVDLNGKRLLTRTRTIDHNPDPEWDEEFEITIPPEQSSLDISVVVWDDRFGQHQLCGKAFLELNPRRFSTSGIPEEITLDLDFQGKVVLEVAVESEILDAKFVMGRAFRALMRAQERSIKLIVEKFSGFIQSCFSRANLKSVCAKGQPSREEFEQSIQNLCDYLNMNLSILKGFLMNEIFMKTMVATWKNVVSAADELMLPKLSKAKINTESGGTSWQSVSSKLATVSLSSIGILGIDGPLSINEIETVLGWLNFLCTFFHHEGNGPPMEDLKTDQYQSLLLVPALYDQTDEYLIEEVERLSTAYVQMLNNRNNADLAFHTENNGNSIKNGKSMNRTGSLLRNNTINANATAKARKQAAKEIKEAKSDPIASKTSKEDIILRILIARGKRNYVCQRLNQRAKLAYSMATERMARAAAERRFN